MEKEKFIEILFNEVSPYVFKKYLKEIKPVLEKALTKIEVLELEEGSPDSNDKALELFIDAKRIEGCSERTLKYYQVTLKQFFSMMTKNYLVVETEDVRRYLSNYKQKNNASKVTIDNVRRVI